MKHKVIGIITTKNRFEFLERAFASAINQSKVLHELIISSDSDDSTSIIKERSLAEQNNISYLQNNHAHNCSGVRNAAIMAYIKNNLQSIEDFDNTYVAFLDDDDIWDEFYVEKCCEYIGSLPDFIVTGLVYQDGSGDKKLSIPQIIHTDDFLKGNPHIQGSNMFIKLTMILKCGLFDENLASSVDRDIFVRIMQLKPTYTIINEHLVYVNVCNDRKRVTNSIELKRNHTETLYDYLIGLGDNKFDAYNHNLADYNALKLVAGDDEKSADFIKKTERKLSIAEILPLERFVEATTPAPETGMLGRETQISLGTDKEGCDELICLYLLNNTGSLDTARELVQEYGYNLDDYKIINYIYPPLD